MSNVQCPISYVHCKMYRFHCLMSHVQYPMSNIQCPMSNAQCIISKTQCIMSIVQCFIFNVQCTICSLYCIMFIASLNHQVCLFFVTLQSMDITQNALSGVDWGEANICQQHHPTNMENGPINATIHI